MNVPEAPAGGENFKSAVIRWIAEAVRYLKEERIQPDNRTTFIRQVPGGKILSARETQHLQSDGSSFKNAMFNVTLGKDENQSEKLFITGFEESYAGWIYYNQNAVHCPKGNVAVSEGYLCINASENAAGITYSIEPTVQDMPILSANDNSSSVPKYPIAYIKEKGESWDIISLFKDHVPVLNCWRECSDEEESGSEES